MSNSGAVYSKWMAQCQSYAPSVHPPDLSQKVVALSTQGAPETPEVIQAFAASRKALCDLTRDTLSQLLGMSPGFQGHYSSFDSIELEGAHEYVRNIFLVFANKPKFSCLLLYGWEAIGTPQAPQAMHLYPGLALAEWMGSELVPFLLDRVLDTRRSESEREACLKTFGAFVELAVQLQKLAETAVSSELFIRTQPEGQSKPVRTSIPPLLLRHTNRALIPLTKLYTSASAVGMGAPSDALRHGIEVVLKEFSSPHALPSPTLLALAATANDLRAFELFFLLGGLFDQAAVNVIAGRVTRADVAHGHVGDEATPLSSPNSQPTHKSNRYSSDSDLLSSAGSSGGAFLGEEERDMFIHLLDAVVRTYSVGAEPAPIPTSVPTTTAVTSRQASFTQLTEPGGGVRPLTLAEAENLLQLLTAGYAQQHTRDVSCFMHRVGDMIPVEDLSRSWWRRRYLGIMNALTTLFSSLRAVSSSVLARFVLVPSTASQSSVVCASSVEALLFVRSVADSLTSAQWSSIVLPALANAATLLVQEARAGSQLKSDQSSALTPFTSASSTSKYYSGTARHVAAVGYVESNAALTSQLSVASERVGTRALASGEFVSELLALLQHCWTLYYEESRAELDARHLAQLSLPLREDLGEPALASVRPFPNPAVAADPISVRATVAEQLFKAIVHLITTPVLVPSQTSQSQGMIQSPTSAQHGAAFNVLLHDHPEVIQLPGQAATILLSHLSENSVGWLHGSLVTHGNSTSVTSVATSAGARIVQHILLRCLGLQSAHTAEVGIPDFTIPSELLTRESAARLILMLASTPSLPALRVLLALCKDHPEFVDDHYTLFEYALMSAARLLSLPLPAAFVSQVPQGQTATSTPELSLVSAALDSANPLAHATHASSALELESKTGHRDPSPTTMLQQPVPALTLEEAKSIYETTFKLIEAFQPWARRITRLQNAANEQARVAGRPRTRFASPAEAYLPAAQRSMLPDLSLRGSALVFSWMLQCFVSNWTPMVLTPHLDATLARAIRTTPEFTPKQLATLLFALPPSIWSPRKIADSRTEPSATELSEIEQKAVGLGQLPAGRGHTLNPAVAVDERAFLNDMTMPRDATAATRYSDPHSVPSAVIAAAATTGTAQQQQLELRGSVAGRAAVQLAGGTSSSAPSHASAIAAASTAANRWRTQEHLRYAMGLRPTLGKLSRIALAQILPQELLGDEDPEVVGVAIDALAKNPERFLSAHFTSVYETALISAGLHPSLPSRPGTAPAIPSSDAAVERSRASTEASPFLEHYMLRQSWGEAEANFSTPSAKADNPFLLPVADRLLHALRVNRDVRQGAASSALNTWLVDLTTRATPLLTELAIRAPNPLHPEHTATPSGYLIPILKLLAYAARVSRENDPEHKPSTAIIAAINGIAARLTAASLRNPSIKNFTNHLVRGGYFEARLTKPVQSNSMQQEQRTHAFTTYSALVQAQRVGAKEQEEAARTALHQLAQDGIGTSSIGNARFVPIPKSLVGNPQVSRRGEVLQTSSPLGNELLVASGHATHLNDDDLELLSAASPGWYELTRTVASSFSAESGGLAQSGGTRGGETQSLLGAHGEGELWYASYANLPAEHLAGAFPSMWGPSETYYGVSAEPVGIAHSINYSGDASDYMPLAPIPIQESASARYHYIPQVDASNEVPFMNCYSPPPQSSQSSQAQYQPPAVTLYTAADIAALPAVPTTVPAIAYRNPLALQVDTSAEATTKDVPPSYRSAVVFP